MGRRKKKKKSIRYEEVELNIMPFIDIFSMLNTFLLTSAVFMSIGMVRVQIPFLSNAAPPNEEPERELTVNIDIQKEKIELKTSYSKAPAQEKSWDYPNTEDGVNELHAQLLKIRIDNPKVDKATVFSDEDVRYESLIKVLDSAKYLKEGDPPVPVVERGSAEATDEDPTFLFPKVVIGSVLL